MAKLGKNEGVNNFDTFGKAVDRYARLEMPRHCHASISTKGLLFNQIKKLPGAARGGAQVSNFSTSG
jgi:hypothetical protein